MTAAPPTGRQVLGDSAVEVSIVIAALNAASTIGDQLDALAAQTFEGNWEVLVVDDGSSDGTAEVVAGWADRLPSLAVLSHAESRGQSHAMNAGARAARGRLVAFCDADDVVSAPWLAGLVSALHEHALVTGPFDLSRLNPSRLHAWRSSPGWQQLPRWHGYLVPVINANMVVRAETFAAVGGFDEALATGEDYDFAFRVQLAGGTVGFAPDAVLHYRLRQGWPYFRRSYEYGVGHVELYLRFRDQGMRRRLLRGALRLVAAVLSAPLVLVPKYRYGWMTLAGVELGRLKGSLDARTLFL